MPGPELTWSEPFCRLEFTEPQPAWPALAFRMALQLCTDLVVPEL